MLPTVSRKPGLATKATAAGGAEVTPTLVPRCSASAARPRRGKVASMADDPVRRQANSLQRSISFVTSARSLRSRWPVDVPSVLLLILGACGQTTVDSRSAQHVAVPHAVSTIAEPGTCIRVDCPATLNEALRTANSQLCANTKAIGRRACGDRVEFWVAHGLATESYFYDIKSGALVGSATENDVLERTEAGRTNSESCSEDCLICGTPNLPMKLCAQPNAREVEGGPHARFPGAMIRAMLANRLYLARSAGT
jgi:hypothetical protein